MRNKSFWLIKTVLLIFIVLAFASAYTFYTVKRLYELGNYSTIYNQLAGNIAQERDVRIRNIYFQTLLKLGRLGEALNFIETQLQQYPNNVQLLQQALMLAEKTHNSQQMIRYAERVLALKPSNLYALETLILAKLSQNLLDELPEYFVKYGELSEEKGRYNSLYGIYLYKLGERENSEFYLLKAINSDYGDSEAHLYLAYLNLEHRNYFNALEHLRRASGNFFISDFMRENLLAWCYYKLGAPAQALKILPEQIWENRVWLKKFTYKDILEENSYVALALAYQDIPKIIAQPNDLQRYVINWFADKGRKFFTYGDNYKALFNYYIAFKIYGQNPEALIGMLNSYANMGMYQTALDYVRVLEGLNYDSASIAPTIEQLSFELAKKFSRVDTTLLEKIEFKRYIPEKKKIVLVVQNDYENFYYWDKGKLIEYVANMLLTAANLGYEFVLATRSAEAKPSPASSTKATQKDTDYPIVRLQFKELSANRFSVHFNYKAIRSKNEYRGKDGFLDMIYDLIDFVRLYFPPAPKLIVYSEDMAGMRGVIDAGVASGVTQGDTFTNLETGLTVAIDEAFDTFSFVHNAGTYSNIHTGLILKSGGQKR